MRGKQSPGMSELEVLYNETRRRIAARNTLIDSAFPDQKEFIEDASRRKAACCTRRAGKTWGTALYMVHTALTKPNSRVLYLALSRGEAKAIVLKDVFQVLDEQFNLGIEIQLSELSLQFPNGSTIKIDGADTSERRHQMFTGVAYDLVVIDEAQFWSTDLVSFIMEKLEPTLVERDGTICLIGVPDPMKSLFWEVVTEQRDETGALKRPGWSNHRWSALDNPHLAAKWKAELEQKIEENPNFIDTVAFKNQWQGEWVDDDSAQCYRFTDARNRVEELPGKVEDYTWVLGGDIGWNPDPMAFALMGWKKDLSDHTLYIPHAFKKVEMTNDEVKHYVDDLKKTYKISRYIIDGVNGNVVSDLQTRLKIPFEKVDKGGMHKGAKHPWINLMSDDLLAGRIKLVGSGANDLADEWTRLTWDRKDPTQEVKSAANHCSDAAMYGWKTCFHFMIKSAQKVGKVLSHVPTFRSDDPNWGRQHEKALQKKMDEKPRLKDLSDWNKI